jgi:hypothetical protein
MAEHMTTRDADNLEPKTQDEMLEEFSILELDDRLEFVAWCDTNCSCTGTGTPTS